MATNNKKEEKLKQEEVAQSISKTEEFYNQHKKTIWVAIICVLVVGLGILGYAKFIYAPAAKEAQEAAFPAEINFQQGEFELALKGDGNVLGFEDVIDQYGAKAGKAVYLYAGACNAQLGNWEDALTYLKKYNGKEPILAARAKACEGDAYVALGDYEAAVRSYKAAVNAADNVFAAGYLLKEGSALEALDRKADALACYKAIEDKYPQSLEAYEIAKNIARVAE